MDKQQAWEQFTKTGSITDYLNYSSCSENSGSAAFKSGEFLNNADNNGRSGNPNQIF